MYKKKKQRDSGIWFLKIGIIIIIIMFHFASSTQGFFV